MAYGVGKRGSNLDAWEHKTPKELDGLVVQRSKTLENPIMKSGGLGVQGTR